MTLILSCFQLKIKRSIEIKLRAKLRRESKSFLQLLNITFQQKVEKYKRKRSFEKCLSVMTTTLTFGTGIHIPSHLLFSQFNQKITSIWSIIYKRICAMVNSNCKIKSDKKINVGYPWSSNYLISTGLVCNFDQN